ncbi:acyl-CoA thioesterase [Melaminivora alkalimesophila]|uniref:Acyl-CoA thioesterase n=1 Tax=Melaminivora alkalimesophila TaxID=1165852 RepID=A0A317R866_9BURK|nr:thioesterase family protein [Melaminivora alkalimesophila]PWW43724.1 acyl-CoA thioesterase [Melaminivora alkalimesophila]
MTDMQTSSTPTAALHPLDQALALEGTGPGRYQGRITQAYWNMVGPYGGLTAALVLEAVMRHPDLLGEPVALTVNYAAALAEGAFTVEATPVRTTRSTQHWTISVLQAGADGGAPQVATTATVLTAQRRETWSGADLPMPEVPGWAECAPVPPVFPVQWLQRYEMRPVAGMLPAQWDGSEHDSTTQLWVRDAPARPLDFPSLAALADVFYPRIWRRRALRVPAGTVSMTVYFHAGAELLARTGDAPLLGQARAQAFHNGFFDQTGQLWNEAGTLLATTHQIVYYKE